MKKSPYRNHRSNKKYSRCLLLLSFLTLGTWIVSCAELGKSSDEESVSQEKYNETVSNYNALVEKYNAATTNGVNKDEQIISLSRQLDQVDSLFGNLKNKRQEAEIFLTLKDCPSAKQKIDDELRALVGEISGEVNALMQSNIPSAFNVMREGVHTIYKEDKREQMLASLYLTQEVLVTSTTGLKADSLYSLNSLVERYNLQCSSKKIEEESSRFKELEDKVVVGSAGGGSEVIDRSALEKRYAGTYNTTAFDQFVGLADGSDGFLGFSPKADLLPHVIDEIFSRLVSGSDTRVDVLFVIDTTSSMSDDISAVKRELQKLLEKLKIDSKDFHVGVLLYRDSGDEYLSKIATSITGDFTKVEQIVQNISVAGGGDHPEAVVDALVSAQSPGVAWRVGSSKNIILVADAPGHEKAKSSEKSLEDIKASLRSAEMKLVVFPILVSE